MNALVAEKGGLITAIYSCPHGPDSACDCRKPKPGLLKSCAQDFNAVLSGIPVIGDSLRDLQAAEAEVYVLIKGFNPIQAYLCDEGLARFCTEDYR